MTPPGPYRLAWRTPSRRPRSRPAPRPAPPPCAGGSGASRSAPVTFGATARLAYVRASCSAPRSARSSIRPCRTMPIQSASTIIASTLSTLNLPRRERRGAITASSAEPASGLRCVPSGSVPEGDTIHYAANRIRPVLAGHVPDELRTPHPRFARGRAGRSGSPGRAVTAVDAHGKHLFLRFEGDLTIHSHLRMTGSWRVPATARAGGARRGAPGSSCAAAIARCVQFDGPVLELMTDVAHALRPAPRGARPGHPRPRARRGALPAPAARGRPDAPDRRRAARPAHDRRHRQPVEGGGLLRGAASTPGAPPGGCRDEEALRDRRTPSARGCSSPRSTATRTATGGSTARAGRAVPALRHADPLARAVGRQPHDLLVPVVPGVTPRVGHKGADHIAPGNTIAVVRRRARARRRHDRVRRPAGGPPGAGSGAAAARARLRATAGAAHARAGARPPRRERAFAGVELDVDLKLPGYEGRVRRGAPRATGWSSGRSSRRSTCAASSCCASSSRDCGSAGRSRACRATTRPRS